MLRFPLSLQERLDLSLFQVEIGHYSSLNIVETVMPHWIVSAVRQGRVETVTQGERSVATEGCAMVHPPRLPFSERAEGPGVHEYFLFEMQVPPNLDIFRLHPVSPVVSLRSPGEFSAVFERLRAVWTAPPSPVRDLRAVTLAGELIAQVLESWQAAGSPPRSPALQTPEDRFAEVVSFMAAHLDRKLTREMLAAKVHLHPGYFDRAFRAAYGAAPMQLLRDLRLRRAAQLLESTDQTLETVAQACGLGDAAAFSRTFKARYQCAPGQYREKAKQARRGYLSPDRFTGPGFF